MMHLALVAPMADRMTWDCTQRAQPARHAHNLGSHTMTLIDAAFLFRELAGISMCIDDQVLRGLRCTEDSLAHVH